MSFALADDTALLGLAPPPGRPLALAERVAAGLPIAALDRLMRAVAPDEDALRYAFVPKATLARRAKARPARLSPEESARIARVARVFALAREAWGSDAEARDFLRRRHPMLEDRTPLDVAIETDIGARIVERILGRLAYGTAA
ncbi:antitoxin Xre/MbcA/ParS toxin-binding domain-containing protein [Roseomonas fluvialis]|uniref:Antitoxin n=1 Tax=Roseomonas fluvialis TaxID=1750527 RepID=A0ABM7Y7I7_9PROT|nr:antitoxin Xre/MbcA/ParS toxin-binding domain-containing protein [Roseomonas fluvialis]BDG73877.1 antitoxin [Roseomonas fluvialis]